MTDSHETYCPVCRDWYPNSAYGCPDCNEAAESHADDKRERRRDWMDDELDNC